MIDRTARREVERGLRERAAVVLTGLPRTGRSSLARMIAGDQGGLVCDASSPSLEAALTGDLLASNEGRLVVIDNIAAASTALIIASVRAGEDTRTPPRFLLLAADTASASLLIAGLIGLAISVELPTIQVEEDFAASQPIALASGPFAPTDMIVRTPNAPQWEQAEHWLRGGLPQSLNADCSRSSFAWRLEYLEALRACEFEGLGGGASDRVHDVLQWLANGHGQIFDENKCGSALAIGRDGVRRCVRLLERIGMVRRLESWPTRSNGSMGRMPVFYIRDTGLLHALVGIATHDHLRSHQLLGHSWEGYAIEALITSTSHSATAGFYRNQQGDEIDLVLGFAEAGGGTYAIECKYSPDKDVEPGFAPACAAIGATDRMIVHSGSSANTHRSGVRAISLLQAIRELRG